MIRYVAIVLLAGAMQIGLDAALPTDTPRLLVIIAGGMAGILWSALDDLILGKTPA